MEIRAKADEWQRVDITFAAGGMPAQGDSKRFGIHNAVHLLKESERTRNMAEKIFDSGTAQRILQQPCNAAALRASLSEVSSLFEEDGMDTALRQASTEISLSVAAGEPFSAAAEKDPAFSSNTPLSVLARQSFPPIGRSA